MSGTQPGRRQWLMLAGVAATAGVAGAAWQSMRSRSQVRIGADEGAPWGEAFATPDGGELVLASLRGHPLLLNFWATWCPPCIKELPDLERFHREWSSHGWRVVGLAVDNARSVNEFLQRQPLTFRIGLAGLQGTELSKQLGNTQGALPFTAVFDRTGRLVQRKLGQTHYEELVQWARAL